MASADARHREQVLPHEHFVRAAEERTGIRQGPLANDGGSDVGTADSRLLRRGALLVLTAGLLRRINQLDRRALSKAAPRCVAFLFCSHFSIGGSKSYEEHLEAVTMSFSRFPTAHDIALSANG